MSNFETIEHYIHEIKGGKSNYEEFYSFFWENASSLSVDQFAFLLEKASEVAQINPQNNAWHSLLDVWHSTINPEKGTVREKILIANENFCTN